MSPQTLVVMTCAYLLALGAVVYCTRATVLRVVGALVGGAVVGVLGIGVIALGNSTGWWRVPLGSSLGFLGLFYLGIAVSCTPIYLVTWRVARRFGWPGLAAFVVVAMGIGPPRDYAIAAKNPEWIRFGSGIAPVVAVALTYMAAVVVGHGMMRWVAGPAAADRLARQPRTAAEPDACKSRISN